MHHGSNTKYEGVSKMSEKSMLEAVKNVGLHQTISYISYQTLRHVWGV